MMPSFVRYRHHIAAFQTKLDPFIVQQKVLSLKQNYLRRNFHFESPSQSFRWCHHYRSFVRYRPFNIFFSTTSSNNEDSDNTSPTSPRPATAFSSQEEVIRPKAASYVEIEDDSDYMLDDDEDYAYSPPPVSSDNVVTLSATKSANMASAIAQSVYSSLAHPEDDAFSSVSSNQQTKIKYSIYDLDATSIREITDIDAIADIVDQLEQMDTIDSKDVALLIVPLSRITSQKRYGERGARLTERLLLTCLGRLPINIFDRYTKKASYVESVTPSKFSTVLDTREWIATSTTKDPANSDDDDALPVSSPAMERTESSPILIRSKLSYPTEDLFTRSIIAWGNLGNSLGLHHAESMFQLQVEEYVRELEFVRYHQVKDKQQRQALKASNSKSDLSFMDLNPELQLPPEPFASPPGRRAYKSLIRAWAVSGEKNAAAKSYELLREMEHLSGVQELLHEPRDTNLRPLPPIPPIAMPDRGTYNLVLSAYTKTFALHQGLIIDRIKKIAQRMRNLHSMTNDDEYILDSYSYIAILQAYAKYVFQCHALEYQYLDDIYSIIRQIHAEIERRKTLPPDLQEKMRGKKRALDDNPSTANKRSDMSVFFPMSMSWAYGIVVDALLKSQPLYQTIFIADDIVVAMTGRRNRINTLPDYTSIHGGASIPSQVPIFIPHEICIKTWPQHDTLMRIVEGWSRSGLPLATERIEHLMYVVVADAHYPRIYFLNETMETWCNSAWHFAPFVVENLLQRGLEKTTHVYNKPTGQTFAIAIRAWMKSAKPEGPYRAELLFQHMLHLYEFKEDTWYKPKEMHLRYIITAWLNRCHTGETYDGIGGKGLYPAEHVEKFISWIQDREWFKTFAEASYSMAIRVWSLQQLPSSTNLSDSAVAPPNPVQRAGVLLNSFADRFVHGGEPIPPYPCNWVLETCSIVQPTKERKIEAYDLAISTFQRCKHNARSFVLMVQVLRAQVQEIDDMHRSVIEDLFRRCCFAGLLTQDMVMHLVSISDDPETIQRLFGLSYQIAQLIIQHRKQLESKGQKLGTDRLPNALMVQNLPKEWSMNVKVSTPKSSPPTESSNTPDSQ
jgi:hypothetical protein